MRLVAIGLLSSRQTKKESVIKIPDVVIQLDCDEKLLLDRYAIRQRDYGLHEECIESVLLLKTNYQGVKKLATNAQS